MSVVTIGSPLLSAPAPETEQPLAPPAELLVVSLQLPADQLRRSMGVLAAKDASPADTQALHYMRRTLTSMAIEAHAGAMQDAEVVLPPATLSAHVVAIEALSLLVNERKTAGKKLMPVHNGYRIVARHAAKEVK